MSNYNWCHGPECHTNHTQSRIRGSGDNKVLRTRRIKVYQPETPHIYDFFCNQRCLMDFIRTHIQSIVAIAPRREALETPIKVEKEKYESYRHRWTDNGAERVPYMATRTTIKSVDNSNG
tara:strand:- start:129 stop:488 length:360 start_codon:yes stop_codon:yes gene_type:complete